MRNILIACFAFCSIIASAQSVDLSKDYMLFGSALEQKVGEAKPSVAEHFIKINTVEKSIVISTKRDESGEEVYHLNYKSAYDGNSRSVQINPGEALFMLNSKELSMVAFSQSKGTFSIIDMNNNIHLYGQIYILED